MKTALIWTLLTLIFLFPLRAQPGGETVTVEVQGLGKDAQSAEKNALYQAVERAVGTYLDNETVVKNEEVIRDKLLTVAQGFVQSYDVLSPPKERRDGSGLWEIKIKAVVKKSDVGAALRSAGVMAAAADGRAAWATQITRLKSREDAMALLEKVIPEIPRNVVVCSLEQAGDKLQIQEDPKTGNQQVVVKVRMEINYNWWVKEAVPALDAAFTQLRLLESKSQEFQLRRTPIECRGQIPVNFCNHIKSLTYTSDNIFELNWTAESLVHYSERRIFLLVETGAKFKFKTYHLPEMWGNQVEALWHNGADYSHEEHLLREHRAKSVAVTIKLEDNAASALLETPLEVPFDFIGVIGAGAHTRDYSRNYSDQEFAPVLNENAKPEAPNGGLPDMASIIYTAKLDVPADTLKVTKRIVLKAARFGIRQQAAPATGTSLNR